MTDLSDTELMALVKLGDFIAFDELYNRYHKPIKRFLFSLVWDDDTAEDYVQEVFLRLYQARNRYESSGKFSTYIFQIARNYYLTQRRKKRLPVVDESRNGFKPFENIRTSEKIEPEIHLMEEYRRWKIRQAIQTLPDNQKLVFVMSHIEGMKYSEISEILQVPVGTVKSRMFKAIGSLKALLKEEQE